MNHPNNRGTETNEAMMILHRKTGRTAAALLAATALAACDTKVTNPGRYADEFLDVATAHVAVVNGSARSLSDAMNYVAYTSGAVTREIFPAGSTSSFGISPRQQQGILAFDDEHITTPWTSAHRARFVAEQGYTRFEAERKASGEPFDSYEPAARAALWAGYANRVLGEAFCQVAFEGGPAVPADSALRRAETWFTRALAIGQKRNQAEIINAALAGRASVRAHLGNWAGAVADANMVPTTFKFVVEYADPATDQYNRIFWAGASTPYRAHTVWRTPYEKYFTDTQDPRVAWGLHPTQKQGDAAVMDLGKVPFLQQRKYTARNSPINLSSGREMRLLEAEAKLRAGDWEGAMTLINSIRTSASAPAVTASNATEAWTRLKRERGIELWLEGRRIGDLRRWKATNTPGDLDPLEMPGSVSKLSANQSLCYPIPKAEIESNPNLR